MKNILFIDDEKDPRVFIKEEATIIVAKNYDEALAALKSDAKIDEIYLDGHLGSPDKGGFQVLAWMMVHGYQLKVIHLISNSCGTVEMMSELLVSDFNMVVVPSSSKHVTLHAGK